MEEKVENKNFFKKIWYSITKFEQYPSMAAEGFGRAIKYLIFLTAIVTLFIMIGSLLQMKELIGNLAQYVQDNIPEFSYEQGKLYMGIEDTLIIDDMGETGIDRVVINTLTETDEQKEKIEKDNSIYGITVFLFNNEIVLKTKLEENQEEKQTYTYGDFIEGYTGENIEKFNKTEFVEYLKNGNMTSFYAKYGASIFVFLLIVNVLVALLDVLEIAILGSITSTFARIRMKFVAIYNMAVYSLTLPMFLNVLYIIIRYFTDFTIKYFQVAYVAIAYIYLAAAIFILKDDIIKKLKEVEKIKQEQLKVREQIKEEVQEKEESKENNDDKKEEQKEDNKGDEPQGSEA